MEIRAPANRETPAYCDIRPDCASIFFPSGVQVDVEIRVSSVAGLAVCARSNVPAFLQCLTDLLLGQMLLLRPIFGHTFWLTVLCDEVRRFHVLRAPIKIVNFLLRTHEIFRVTMAFETPGHAVRLGNRHGRHVIHRTVATEATDTAI